jgi:hypothetical protein
MKKLLSAAAALALAASAHAGDCYSDPDPLQSFGAAFTCVPASYSNPGDATFRFLVNTVTDVPPAYDNPEIILTGTRVLTITEPWNYHFEQDPNIDNGETTIIVDVENGHLIRDYYQQALDTDYYIYDFNDHGGTGFSARLTTGAGITVTTNAIFAPIPEPANAALLLVGLGLLANALKRKR